MKESILLVEDEDYMAEYLCTALKPFGYVIDVVPTGAQGLIRGAHGQYDLVLIDVLLDDGLGTDLITPLKQQSLSRPVIVLTGVPPDPELVSECSQKGAFAYVSKTAPIDDLVMHIRGALRK
jgi:DNA-binding response OmpR family regulator